MIIHVRAELLYTGTLIFAGENSIRSGNKLFKYTRIDILYPRHAFFFLEKTHQLRLNTNVKKAEQSISEDLPIRTKVICSMGRKSLSIIICFF